jgi:hypothetical protein
MENTRKIEQNRQPAILTIEKDFHTRISGQVTSSGRTDGLLMDIASVKVVRPLQVARPIIF